MHRRHASSRRLGRRDAVARHCWRRTGSRERGAADQHARIANSSAAAHGLLPTLTSRGGRHARAHAWARAVSRGAVAVAQRVPRPVRAIGKRETARYTPGVPPVACQVTARVLAGARSAEALELGHARVQRVHLRLVGLRVGAPNVRQCEKAKPAKARPSRAAHAPARADDALHVARRM